MGYMKYRSRLLTAHRYVRGSSSYLRQRKLIVFGLTLIFNCFSENFSMRNIKYPSKETGDVAPGMSVIVSISFSAPSFGDFDDVLTVVTEENSFKVPLRARRDPPVISLVNPLDCLHSWIGD